MEQLRKENQVRVQQSLEQYSKEPLKWIDLPHRSMIL